MSVGWKVYGILMILMFGFLTVNLFQDWDHYDTCKEPIEVFLLMVYSLSIFSGIFLLASQSNHFQRSRSFQKCSHFIVLFLYGPATIYLVVQGSIWQAENMRETPNCASFDQSNTLIIEYIVAMGILSLMYIFVLISSIISYWRLRIFRRRLLNILNNPDRPENQRLLQALLGNNHRATSEDPGLTQYEINKLPSTQYTTSVLNVLSFNQLSCLVCLQDYKVGDPVTTLPACQHLFHSHCITNWLVRRPFCPMCRSNVRSYVRSDSNSNNLRESSGNSIVTFN